MVSRGSQRGKQQIVTTSSDDGVVKPTVVELAADGATVESPHAAVGGSATTTVAFKMNVWADGGTMTLTPTTADSGVTFSPVVVPAKGITSANSTCTVTAGRAALADVPISIAFSGSATNQPTADIVVTGSNTLALTAGPAYYANLPWQSLSVTNGWTQVWHIPQGVWGSDDIITYPNNTVTFNETSTRGNKPSQDPHLSSSEWRTAFQDVSGWNEICFQAINDTGSNGYPNNYVIWNKQELIDNYVTNKDQFWQRAGVAALDSVGGARSWADYVTSPTLINASHDYFYFKINSTDPRGPWIYALATNVGSGGGTPQRAAPLIFQEGGAVANHGIYQPAFSAVGVFIRNQPS